MADLMISYARESSAFVGRLKERLEADGLSLWIDASGILPSAPVLGEIQAAISGAAAVVLVLGPDWLSSEYCQEELKYAWSQNKRLIPLLTEPIDPALVDPRLADVNWIRFDQLPFEDAVTELRRAFDLDIARVRLHARLLQRALLWQADSEASRLLRSRELQEAEQWLAATPAGADALPTPLQRSFVLASRQAETRRQRQTLGAVSTALVVMTALAIATFLFYRSAEARRKIALSRLLAAESDSRRGENLDQALLLASHAFQLEPTLEARGSLLRQSIEQQYLTRVLWGGSGGIEGLAISQDGALVAAGDSSGRVLVWRSADGTAVGEPMPANDPAGDDSPAVVAAVELRPRSPAPELTAASLDGTLRTWRIGEKGLEVLDSRSFPAPLYSLAYSDDGGKLAVGDVLGTVTVLGGSGGSDSWTIEPEREAPVTALSFSHDAKRLAIGRGDRRIFVHDLEHPDAAPGVLSAAAPIAGLAFSPDDSRLLVGGGESIVIRDPRDPEKVFETRPVGAAVLSLAASQDGGLLAAGLQNGQTELIFLEGDRENRILRGHSGRLRSTAISGDLLATGAADGRVLLWSLSSDSSFATRTVVHLSDPVALAFDPRGNTLASLDMGSGLALWNGQSGKLDFEQLDEWLDNADHLAFGPAGDRILVTGQPGQILLLTTSTEEWAGRAAAVPGVAAAFFTTDGDGIVGLTDTGEVVYLSPQLEEQRRCAPIFSSRDFLQLARSGEGSRLAVAAGDGELIAIDLADCSHLSKQIEAEVSGIAFLGEHRVIVATGPGDLVVWDLRSRDEPFRVATGHDRLMSLAAAPAGDLVAIGDDEGLVELWDTSQWRRIGPAIQAHDMFVSTLAFGPGGARLASAGNDGRLAVFDVDPASWAAAACRRAARPLRPAERSLFDLRDARDCSVAGTKNPAWSSARFPPDFVPPKPGVRGIGGERAIVRNQLPRTRGESIQFGGFSPASASMAGCRHCTSPRGGGGTSLLQTRPQALTRAPQTM